MTPNLDRGIRDPPLATIASKSIINYDIILNNNITLTSEDFPRDKVRSLQKKKLSLILNQR